MGVGFRVDPRDAVPVWQQIERGMTRLVVSGALEVGAAVPSVRDLARELGVNPMTVAKAYQRLGEAGILESRRGEGTFVLPRPSGDGHDGSAVEEETDLLALAAARLGISEEETLAEVRNAFRRLRQVRGRREAR